MGDGHVASAASVVTWRDVCIARATQRPFPVAVGVISARCGGGATPKLAFLLRREPQEHPFGAIVAYTESCFSFISPHPCLVTGNYSLRVILRVKLP